MGILDKIHKAVAMNLFSYDVENDSYVDEEPKCSGEVTPAMTDYANYLTRVEGHHSDGSGRGPADTFLPRIAHTWVHQDVAGACRSLGEPTSRGFCGDPTTRKLGNRFFGADPLPSDDDYEFPAFLNSREKKPEFNFIGNPIEASIKKTIDELTSRQRSETFGPEASLGKTLPDSLTYKANQEHWLGNTCSVPFSSHGANQEHWMGGRTTWQANPISYSPVLPPVDINRDIYAIAERAGRDLLRSIQLTQEAREIAARSIRTPAIEHAERIMRDGGTLMDINEHNASLGTVPRMSYLEMKGLK